MGIAGGHGYAGVGRRGWARAGVGAERRRTAGLEEEEEGGEAPGHLEKEAAGGGGDPEEGDDGGLRVRAGAGWVRGGVRCGQGGVERRGAGAKGGKKSGWRAAQARSLTGRNPA